MDLAGRAWAAAFAACVLTTFAVAQTDVVTLGNRRLYSAWNEERFVELSMAEYWSLALRPDGTLEAWGWVQPRTLEAFELPPGLRYEDVAAGFGHGLAVRSDGRVIAGGYGVEGQCDVPELPPERRYVAVAAGQSHSLALVDDGTLMAFGRNREGQCRVPPLPAGVQYVLVAAAEHHSMALRSDGQAVLWGDPRFGIEDIPPADPDNPYVQMSVGYAHSVLLRADGSAIGTGLNHARQIEIPPPPAGTKYLQVAAGRNFTLTLRSDGKVQVWGHLAHFGDLIHEAEVPLGRSVVAMSASNYQALLLLDNGSFLALGFGWGWGACNLPKLPPGIDYVQLQSSPMYETGGALLSDGSLLVWGPGAPSELGVPALPPGVRYTQFELDDDWAIALRDDGEVVVWGYVWSSISDVPELPPGVHYTDVAALGAVALAVASDGELRAWGEDFCCANLLDVPPLPTGIHYVSVSAEGLTALALRSDGVVIGWGLDTFGYTGPVPRPPAGQDFVGLEAGEWGHVAHTGQGNVAVWGLSFGSPCDVPPLPSGTGVVAAAAGYVDVYAILDDGTLFGLSYSGYYAWSQVTSPAQERHLALFARGNFASATVAEIACAGEITSFCPPGKSVRSGAHAGQFQVLGCPDHEKTSLTFVVDGLPAASLGFFVYGEPAVADPFSSQDLCVRGTATRVPGAWIADAAGSVSYGVDVNAAPFDLAGTAVLPGQTVAFQYVYRDSSTGGASELTNAVAITFAP